MPIQQGAPNEGRLQRLRIWSLKVFWVVTYVLCHSLLTNHTNSLRYLKTLKHSHQNSPRWPEKPSKDGRFIPLLAIQPHSPPKQQKPKPNRSQVTERIPEKSHGSSCGHPTPNHRPHPQAVWIPWSTKAGEKMQQKDPWHQSNPNPKKTLTHILTRFGLSPQGSHRPPNFGCFWGSGFCPVFQRLSLARQLRWMASGEGVASSL